MNDKSRKAEILRRNSGTSRVFARCMAARAIRCEQARELTLQSLSIYAVEVLARLNETIDAIESAYREYHFNLVAQHLYNFVWSDYCDWFVEAAKTDIFSEDEAKKKSALAVMDVVLSATLRLLHPFMPHLTEEIWSLLGFGKDSIQFAAPPEKVALDAVSRRCRKAATRIKHLRNRSSRSQSEISIEVAFKQKDTISFYARMINRFLSKFPP